MKTTSITRLRADTTRLVQDLRAGADEPVLVLQNAEIAAYLVSPKLWDELQPSSSDCASATASSSGTASRTRSCRPPPARPSRSIRPRSWPSTG